MDAPGVAHKAQSSHICGFPRPPRSERHADQVPRAGWNPPSLLGGCEVVTVSPVLNDPAIGVAEPVGVRNGEGSAGRRHNLADRARAVIVHDRTSMTAGHREVNNDEIAICYYLVNVKAQIGEGSAQPQGCGVERGRSHAAGRHGLPGCLPVDRLGMDHGLELAEISAGHDVEAADACRPRAVCGRRSLG